MISASKYLLSLASEYAGSRNDKCSAMPFLLHQDNYLARDLCSALVDVHHCLRKHLITGHTLMYEMGLRKMPTN